MNFSRDTLKNMDEADASHVKGIHYVATADIRIGKEKLEMIKLGTRFWPTVLEYKKKGKINSDDAKLPNLNVRDLTNEQIRLITTQLVVGIESLLVVVIEYMVVILGIVSV